MSGGTTDPTNGASGDGHLEAGREAFRRHAWFEAGAELQAADEMSSLEPEDLKRLAVTHYMLDHRDAWEETWARAHQEALRSDDHRRAARYAFWLGFGLASRGEHAPAGGWFARASRTLDRGGSECEECVERGYLLLPKALRAIGGGDDAGALEIFRTATEMGERFRDPDLATYARHGQGRAMMRMGELEAGVALLDEAMVAVTAGEVAPMVAGDIYCSVIEACQETFDLRRAHEWTAALTRWCEEQPDLMAFRGQCLTRRSEILQLHGEWPDALEEARRAGERLTSPPGRAAAGAAFYQQGEIHRLRGRFEEAEEAYREASEWGRNPQPGLALLRLAQGDLDSAATAMRRVVVEAGTPRARSRVLGAHVEVMRAAGDLETARDAADELTELAEALDAPALRASASAARGAVLLDEGDPQAALADLRRAWTSWQDLDAPHEAGRVQLSIVRACRRLGDEDTAALELAAARRTFERLGAAPALEEAESLRGDTVGTERGHRPGEASGEGVGDLPDAGHGSERDGGHDAGLTSRELEVLRLVATGATNREIGDELFISEKTVARHLSNTFRKLGVSTRTAATAYAYEHGLI